MKILIIAKNVGRVAPGIVCERLIKGLSDKHELDILTTDFAPSIIFDKINTVIKFKYRETHASIAKLFISFFGVNPLDIYFANKAVTQCNDKYDLILSIISSNHYISLMIGNRLSQKTKLKHFTHFLDAIPAPGAWLKNDLFCKRLKRFVYKNLAKVDALFSTNQKMLDYQLSTFKAKKNLISEVIFNPAETTFQYFPYSNKHINTFLFTGGLYGPRKPDYLLAAFKVLLKDYPNSKLEFVGSRIPSNCFSIFSASEREKIILHPFTKDLNNYYERATALIDIDADTEDDVFLSSKIINYIMINRTIISETGIRSPSREIFKGIPSILQCAHDINELVDAMKQAISEKGKEDFCDRADVISLFKLSSVIDKLNNAINQEHPLISVERIYGG